MIGILAKLYRANPVRPHCDAGVGRHVWLCRALLQQEHCKMVSAGFNRGGTRCPAKDA